MIRASVKDGGVTVAIETTPIDSFFELAYLIDGVKKNIEKRYTSEFADKLITLSGKYAYADEDKKDEVIDEFEALLGAWLEKR